MGNMAANMRECYCVIGSCDKYTRAGSYDHIYFQPTDPSCKNRAPYVPPWIEAIQNADEEVAVGFGSGMNSVFRDTPTLQVGSDLSLMPMEVAGIDTLMRSRMQCNMPCSEIVALLDGNCGATYRHAV